jgi:hypothetical protein
MTESHVISALVNKKAELLGLIEYHQKEIKKLTEVMTHLNASIKVFDPNYNLSSIQSRQFRTKNQIFAHGELSVLIFEVLREAESPLTSAQVADAIKSKKNITVNIIENVQSSLQLQARNGNIQKEIKNKIAFWSKNQL